LAKGTPPALNLTPQLVPMTLSQPSRDEANCSTLLIYPRDYSALSIIGMECQKYFFSSNMLEVSKLISIENTRP